jgi:hypothetical protein
MAAVSAGRVFDQAVPVNVSLKLDKDHPAAVKAAPELG